MSKCTRRSPRPPPESAGMPLSPQDAHIARLGSRSDLELDLSLCRGHGDRRADRGIDHGQADDGDQVVAVARKSLVGMDTNLDEGVARLPAERARVSFAAHADPLPVVDAGGYLDIEQPLRDEPPVAVAALARLLDDPARTVTARTGRRTDELAEDALRDLLDAARAAAGVARDGRRAGLRPGAAASLAGDGHLQRHLYVRPVERLDERDLDGRPDILAARPPPCLREEALAEERGEQIRDVPEVELGRRKAAAAEPRVAVAVVGLPAPAVGEHLVGLGDLLEALSRVGLAGDVRVQLAREPPERPLDLVVAGVAPDAEQLVVVTLRSRHGSRVRGRPVHASS